jgi:autotransporter-associated beta strand protein
MHTKRNRLLAAAVVAAVGTVGTTHAATYTYTNNTGGTWSTPTNWTSGGSSGVPLSGAATTLDFSGLGTSFTSTNDLGTQASPLTLNRLVFGTSGTPTISGGYLQFAGADATLQKKAAGGTVGLNTNVVLGDGVTLNYIGNALEQVNVSSTVKVTGAGGIDIKSGSLVMISANSDYAGGTTLGGGELVIFADSALNASNQLIRGPVGTGTLTINGGIIRTNSGNARTLYNAINIGGNFQASSSSGNNLTFAGPVTIAGTNATRTVTVSNAKSLTLSGQVGDGGGGNGLIITGNGASGAGTVTMGGGITDTAGNTFTGTTTLASDRATLVFDKAEGTNAIGGNLLYSGVGTLVWNRGHQLADTATVSVTGGTLTMGVSENVASFNVSGGSFKSTTGVTLGMNSLVVSGGFSHTHGAVLAIGAGGLVINQQATGTGVLDALVMSNGGAGVLRLGGDVTFNASAADYQARIRQGASASSIDLQGGIRTFNIGDGANAQDLVLTLPVFDTIGGGGITKTGAGTLMLANSNVFTGPTSVSAGRLLVHNTAGSATGSGAVGVASGATIAGSGLVGGAVTIDGIADPVLEVGGAMNAPSTTPHLTLASAVFRDGSTLKLELGALSDRLIVTNALDLAGAQTLALTGSVDTDTVLATYGSLVGTFDTVTLNGSALPGYYAIQYTATDGPGQVVLSVPEPSSIGLIAVGALGLLKRRRRGR